MNSIKRENNVATKVNTYRTTAKVVGALYILGFVVGIAGSALGTPGQSLSIPYQEVIALRYFEGKNNKEIAEILDIKEGTIKSLLSRGLERLRMKCNQL